MRRTSLLVAALLCALLAACSTVEPRSLEFGPSDVDHVEVATWRLTPSSEVRAWTVRDRREIDSLMVAYRDLPATPVSSERDGLAGARVQALTFAMRDGRSIVVAQVMVEPFKSIVVWPEGSATSLANGQTLLEIPADAARVSMDAVPKIVIP